MKNLLNCKVVMLPTEEDSDILIQNENLYLKKNIANFESVHNFFGKEHLYLTSDRKIKEGDWFLCLDDTNDIYQANDKWLRILKHESKRGTALKIEATTDTELGNMGVDKWHHQLPQIPKSFVEAYVKANGKIEEVNIEMEQTSGLISNDVVVKDKWNKISDHKYTYERVKTRPDNTVIIHQVKTYTRDEVIKLIQKYHNEVHDNIESATINDEGFSLYKWIKENL